MIDSDEKRRRDKANGDAIADSVLELLRRINQKRWDN
jgi:hypothetical protein